MREWLTNLPDVKGRYQISAPLSRQTWFQVGGKADLLFRPETPEALTTFLQNKPEGIPLTLLGAGSNVLVGDGGISGVVIRLGRDFATIEIEGTNSITGAAALNRTVAFICADAGLSGLEFLIGIPGTIGGSVKMNAGCYGKEIKDVLLWADVMNNQGKVTRFLKSELGFNYRHSALQSDQIVIGACFELKREDPGIIQNRLVSFLKEREQSQPIRGRTGGSTFKNPINHKAWHLIDEAGCRGLQIGQAQVSEKHCNFLLNLGKSTAKELVDLAEQVQKRVQITSGILLEWEIIRLGKFL